VRSLFVDDLTEPVLKMLGTKYVLLCARLLALMDLMHRYNIEPFFFTSSVNWIPSRYQEALSHGEGDRKSKTFHFGVQANTYHKTLLLPCHSYELPQHQRDRSHLGRQITRLTPRNLFLCSVCVLLSLWSRSDLSSRSPYALHGPPRDSYGSQRTK